MPLGHQGPFQLYLCWFLAFSLKFGLGSKSLGLFALRSSLYPQCLLCLPSSILITLLPSLAICRAQGLHGGSCCGLQGHVP